MALLTLMKGQPLAYNKDNQEDKEPLFDTADTVIDTLRIYADMMEPAASRVSSARQAEAMQRRADARATPPPPTSPTTWSRRACPSATPTRPSRWPCAAPRRVIDLPQFTLDELVPPWPTCPARSTLGADVFGVLTVEGSLASRNHIGGTAPEQVRAAIARAPAQPGLRDGGMERIGKYENQAQAGEGATSTVYLAYDPFAQAEVAIKRLHPELLRITDHTTLYRQLLLNEAALAGKLHHPHIVGSTTR